MSEALALAFNAVLTPLGWFTTILDKAGALGTFVALFFAGVVMRLIVRPLVGDAVQEQASSLRDEVRSGSIRGRERSQRSNFRSAKSSSDSSSRRSTGALTRNK